MITIFLILLVEFFIVYFLCRRYPKLFLLFIALAPLVIFVVVQIIYIFFSDAPADAMSSVDFGLKLLMTMGLSILVACISCLFSKK